jgi:hypothetical protein
MQTILSTNILRHRVKSREVVCAFSIHPIHRRLSARSMSRLASCFLIASRLS